MMALAIAVQAVAAESSPLEAIGRHFSRSVSPMYYVAGLAVVLTIVLMCLVFARVYQKRLHPEAVHEPAALFECLCDAHGLRPEQCRVLVDLAGGDAEAAASLFVSPTRFAQAAQDALDDQEEPTLAVFDAVERLRRQIFGDGPEGEGTPVSG